MSHFSERFLERFSCKIMAAANNFFRFAVAILFVYIGSRNFYTLPDGTCDQAEVPRDRDRLSVSGDQIRSDRRIISSGVSLAIH